MGRRKEKDIEILHELYRRSFAASTPRGDWDELLVNAQLDKDGRKIIPYMDYECTREKMEEIFETVMKEYKVPKRKLKDFSFAFWLGCSPKTANPHERKEISGV